MPTLRTLVTGNVRPASVTTEMSTVNDPLAEAPSANVTFDSVKVTKSSALTAVDPTNVTYAAMIEAVSVVLGFDVKAIFGNLEQYSLSVISALAERAVAALVPR